MPDAKFRFKDSEYAGGKRPSNSSKILMCEQNQSWQRMSCFVTGILPKGSCFENT
jgi:hypothetical protein